MLEMDRAVGEHGAIRPNRGVNQSIAHSHDEGDRASLSDRHTRALLDDARRIVWRRRQSPDAERRHRRQQSDQRDGDDELDEREAGHSLADHVGHTLYTACSNAAAMSATADAKTSSRIGSSIRTR